MGQQGEVSEIHGSLEWSAKGDSGERHVSVASKDGATTIRGSANLTNAGVLTFLPAGIINLMVLVAGVANLVKDGSPVALIVGLAMLPVLYPILRTVLGKISGSESAKLQRVVDELARRVEEGQE